MTKYIRTKTEIKKIETTLNNKELFDYLAQFDNYKDDLIKAVDTIEEAFDEFVVAAPYRFKFPKTASEVNRDFDEMKDFYTDKDDIIYGAIWTTGEHGEPILKSIAKMKGILPNGEIDWELL